MAGGIVAAATLGFFYRAYDQIEALWQRDSLDRPPPAVGEEEGVDESSSLTQQFWAYALSLPPALIGVFAADRFFEWWVTLAILAIGGVVASWKWVREVFERPEMLDRQIRGLELGADQIQIGSKVIELPREAVWGFVGALGLLAGIVGLILLLD